MVQEVRPPCSQVDLDGDENAAATATAADVMTRDDSDAEDSAEATDESSQDDMAEGGHPLTLPSSSHQPCLPGQRRFKQQPAPSGVSPLLASVKVCKCVIPEARRTLCLVPGSCASTHGAFGGEPVAPDAGTEDEGRPAETAGPAAEGEAPGGGALPNGSGQSPPRQEYRGPTAGCTAVGHCPLKSWHSQTQRHHPILCS